MTTTSDNSLPPTGQFIKQQLPENEARRSALECPSEQSLRVPCYCEENVYRLASRKLDRRDGGCYYVLFLSSKSYCVPMFNQRASKTPETVILWDYHVILLQATHDHQLLIYDLDSVLPYPCPLHDYVEYSFPHPDTLPAEYAPLARVIPAESFLRNFFSDRSHMRLPTGGWSAPPPSYACIQTQAGSNLDQYRIMKKEDDKLMLEASYGAVMTIRQLLEYFEKA